MDKLNRRDALRHLGLGTAGLLWLQRTAQASGAPPPASATPPPRADLMALADDFRAADGDAVFDRAATAIRAGADYRALLGASFLAGIHDVQPRGVGGKLHCVMMVESAFQLCEGASEIEAYLAALWSLHDFKRSQARDRSEGDWVLPPRPAASFPSETAARREFVAAMDAWDVERADRALVGLLPFRRHDAMFELLWPYAARSYVDIGHKIIFCAQVERVLRRLDSEYAEPALRSLVIGLLYLDDAISGTEEGVWTAARALAPRLPAGWLRGREEPARSAELLRGLRGVEPAVAQRLVVDAFVDGLGPATVWDGLRLYAAEVFSRRPRGAWRRAGPVHGVTEVNAFAHAWRTSRDDTTKRLMVLQAAGWLALLRRDFERLYGPHEGPGLDAPLFLEGPVPQLAEVFERKLPAVARVRLEREPGSVAPFVAGLRGHLVRKADQDHQYKYAAAVVEETALVAPRYAARVLAPAVTYLPIADDPETEAYRRSRHALRQAGVAS